MKALTEIQRRGIRRRLATLRSRGKSFYPLDRSLPGRESAAKDRVFFLGYEIQIDRKPRPEPVRIGEVLKQLFHEVAESSNPSPSPCPDPEDLWGNIPNPP